MMSKVELPGAPNGGTNEPATLSLEDVTGALEQDIRIAMEERKYKTAAGLQGLLDAIFSDRTLVFKWGQFRVVQPVIGAARGSGASGVVVRREGYNLLKVMAYNHLLVIAAALNDYVAARLPDAKRPATFDANNRSIPVASPE